MCVFNSNHGKYRALITLLIQRDHINEPLSMLQSLLSQKVNEKRVGSLYVNI